LPGRKGVLEKFHRYLRRQGTYIFSIRQPCRSPR
jgi:hypothetical protein